MSSAMITEPPSPAKLELIRKFLRFNRTQGTIDSGSFVQHLGLPRPGAATGLGTATIGEAMDAVLAAYEKHRPTWQDEYEGHVNWEFTEDELRQIVGFLETDVGQHFLEGRWRMDAYVGTNTEHLLEEIASEAAELVAASRK